MGMEATVRLPGRGVDPSLLDRTLEWPTGSVGPTGAADPFELPPPPPSGPVGGGTLPPLPPAPPGVPDQPPAPPGPSTGWTGLMPVVPSEPVPPAGSAGNAGSAGHAGGAAHAAGQSVESSSVLARGVGGGLRGRVLVVEGGYGGRRSWGRAGAAHAPVLSALLAGVAPQVLLSADAVDAVHLPGAADPQSVLAHLRAAARHPGPLLIHLGGHLIVDKRGQCYLTLRDSKPADSLPWSAIANELRHRPAELDTLVIADLSTDHAIWPQLQPSVGALADGLPLWGVIGPDPEQLGTFTRALIETLHRGRPGADAVLTPEQLSQQVHSVLRPETVVLTTHAPDRPYFRNTSRQIGAAAVAETAETVMLPLQPTPEPPAEPPVVLAKPRLSPSWTPRGMVSLRKPGVPPTPPRPPRPVSLLKAGDDSARAAAAAPDSNVTVDLGMLGDTAAHTPADRIELAEPGAGAARVALGKPATDTPVEGDRVELGKPTAEVEQDRVELGKPGTAAPAPTERVALGKPAAGAAPADAEAPAGSDGDRVGLGKPAGAERVELGKGAARVEPVGDGTDGPVGRGTQAAGPERVGLGKPAGAERVELGKRAEPDATAEAVTGQGERTVDAERVELGKAGGRGDAKVELGKPAGAEPAAFGTTADTDANAEADSTAAADADTGTDAPAAGTDRVELAKPVAPDAEPPAALPPVDYREAIGRIVRTADAGEHAAASALALELEQQAEAEHGSVSPMVLQVRQVRAHVARLAGDPASAAALYREVAFVLLRAQGAEHPETQQAATNAEACWRAIKDVAEAIRVAPDIIELRAHLPGPDGRKLRAAERYLLQLADAKAAAASG